MKKALIVGLVVLILVTGIPLLVGMGGMTSCRDCGPAVATAVGCGAAVLFLTVGLLLLALCALTRPGRRDLLDQLVALRLERPPRFV